MSHRRQLGVLVPIVKTLSSIIQGNKMVSSCQLLHQVTFPYFWLPFFPDSIQRVKSRISRSCTRLFHCLDLEPLGPSVCNLGGKLSINAIILSSFQFGASLLPRNIELPPEIQSWNSSDFLFCQSKFAIAYFLELLIERYTKKRTPRMSRCCLDLLCFYYS